MSNNQDIEDQAIAIIKAGVAKAGSEKALAKAAGLRPETIRHWMGRSLPTLEALKKIQHFLAVDLDDGTGSKRL